MYDYDDNAWELHEKTEISINDIYDYTGRRLEELFEHYYQMCQENLSVTNAEYIPQPAKIYFSTATEFNAGARKKWGYSLIRINKEVIETLHDIMLNRFGKAISNDTGDTVLRYEDSPINTMMLQSALLFLFYHEQSHLIQNSKNNDVEREEHYSFSGSGDFNFEDHLMEVDADIYAADYLCDHILAFIKENPDQKFADDTIIFSLIGVWILFLKLYEGQPDLYYQNRTHPHPAIRLSIVISVVFQNLSRNFEHISNLNHLKIDELHISNGVGNICQSRLQGYFEGNLPSDYLRLVRENLSGIKEYVHKLLPEINSHPQSAYNVKAAKDKTLNPK